MCMCVCTILYLTYKDTVQRSECICVCGFALINIINVSSAEADFVVYMYLCEIILYVCVSPAAIGQIVTV